MTESKILFIFLINFFQNVNLSKNYENEIIRKSAINYIATTTLQLYSVQRSVVDSRLISQNDKSPLQISEDPEIMCMEKAVGISVVTKNPYFGRIFVNGLSEMSECNRQFNTQYRAGKFEIPFGLCDMRANRIVSEQ